MAVFAVMPLDVTADLFIERVRDIVNFSKSDHLLQSGKLSNPPRIEDLANSNFREVRHRFTPLLQTETM